MSGRTRAAGRAGTRPYRTGFVVTALLAVALLGAALGPSPVSAHQTMNAVAAEDFLNRVGQYGAAIESAGSADEKAEALYGLGSTLTEVTDLLNRDLASHGGRAGLVSALLVAQLKSRGIELSISEETNLYESHLGPYEEYLALAADGQWRADAIFRILYGRFYESFIYDPMQPLGLDWAGLRDQIETAETFVAHYPDHVGREEVQFILAVQFARAARLAPDPSAYRERARVALTEFQEAYPESLRAVAAEALLQGLPADD